MHTSPTRRIAATVTGVTVVAMLAACASAQPAEPTVSKLTTNISSFVLSGNWNPVTSTYLNAFNLPQQAPYESLIQLNPATFEWEPLLAEEYVVSDDQMSMRLKLREDVDFTDGTHLDAEAAKKAFDYAMEGTTHATLKAQYAPEFEVTGEYELEVTSQGAMGSDFLFWFGIVPIASPTAIETDPTGIEESPVGTGPYILKEQVPDASVTFERNPDYRNPEAFPFDEVEFIIFDDPVAASNALKSGQINAAVVEPSYAADLESNGFALHIGVGGNVIINWADPNGKVVPAFADVRVRQALAHAFDRAAIIENIEFGYGTVTSQVWGKGSPYYIEGADDTYAYDLDKARELMAEAGYEAGFEMKMPSHPSVTKYEPVITQALADLGITVTFDSYVDTFEYFTAADSGDYALTFRATSDLWNSLRAIPDGGFPEITELYEVVDTGTKQEAADALQEIGQRVVDEALVIALSRPAEIWATVPEITVESVIVSWPVLLRGFQLAE